MNFFHHTTFRSFATVLRIGFLFALAMVSGCSNRGTNAPTIVVEEWGLAPKSGSNQIFDFPGLYFQPQNATGLQLMTAYLPKESFPPPTGTSRRVPLLVLLAPAFSSQDYFFNTGGLFELVQEMTAKGEIEPMAIVCLGDKRSFGGFFYARSIPGGDYDSILGQQFINALVNFKGYNIRSERDKHGIGGIGMGAYGAYRQAIVNSAVWGSVSGVDGPLDFDGPNGTSGFLNIFDSAVAETPAGPGTFYQRFDTLSTSRPATSIVVSAAFAFSADDTGRIVGTNLRDSTLLNPNRKFLKIRSRQYLARTAADSVTLLDSFYRPSGFSNASLTVTYVLEGSPFLNVLLPFLPDGSPHPPIWNRWLANNLSSLNTTFGNPLTGAQMFVASSDNARFGYGEMSRAWAATLTTAYPGNVQTYEYGGYQGSPASENQYTYDMLRKMLLFHNEAFKD